MFPHFKEFLDKSVLWLIILVKIIVLYFVTSFYVPDEYWQNLEVAHRQAFGYGHLTWEWKYKTGSYIYPFIISIIYKILAILGLDYPVMIIYSPRIFQAVLSGFAEYRFFKWTQSVEAVGFLVFNAFWQLCSTRTLDHTLEASLMIIALSICPWKNEDKHGSKFIWLVGFMFFIRPTSVIMCAPLCIRHIYYSDKTINQLIKDYFLIGLCVSGIAIAIDSYCYGQLVVTPWEFFKVNVLTDIGNHHEIHSILWYFYPTIFYFLSVRVITLIFTFEKLFCDQINDEKQLTSIFILTWTILIYSLLPHKEHHFLLPLLPLLIYVSTGINWSELFNEKASRFLNVITIIVNIWFFYQSAIDRRGATQIMSYLREEIPRSLSDVDVMFLTPCYTTPFYSHVHQNISMEFLTCEPNFQNQGNYVNEADIFFNNPEAWLGKRYTNSTLPSFVIMYDSLAPRIKSFIDRNYNLVATVFDSWYRSKENGGHNFVLYKLKYETSSM